MSDAAGYKVGYGRPPKEFQFKKGQRAPNQHRRPKSETLDVNAFFAEKVVVPGDGRVTRMDAFEVSLTNIAAKVISKRDMRAARRFLDECEDARLLVSEKGENAWPLLLSIPKDYDIVLWRENLDKLGPPPWSGEHDGLPRRIAFREPLNER